MSIQRRAIETGGRPTRLGDARARLRLSAAQPDSWRRLLLVAASLVVAVAMVTTAELARESSDRHRRAQVLVESVLASGAQLNAISYEVATQVLSSQISRRRVSLNAGVVNSGFAVWKELSGALKGLSALEHDARSATLTRDADQLFAVGVKTLQFAQSRTLPGGTATEDRFRPAIDRLNADALAVSSWESAVADTASSDAQTAFIGSLAVGLIALVLLVGHFHRLLRRTMLATAREAIETRSEERLRALVQHSTDVVTVVGPDLKVIWQADSVLRVLGHRPEAMLGAPLTDIVYPGDVVYVEQFLATSIKRVGSHTFSARLAHADGGWRHVETVVENLLHDPAVAGLLLSMRDVTERKALEDELRHQAFHDSLTGLANRALFEDRLSHALAGVTRSGGSLAVLFLDLDDFKVINDTLGHCRGDELLTAVSARIHEVLRPADTAARLGGDEFAVLIDVLLDTDDTDAEAVARRIRDAMAPPFTVGGRELRVTASVGVALWDGLAGVDDLLRNADMAMYAAKEQGKGSIRTFEPRMHQRVLDRLELTGELRRAIDAHEFELDYQPIVELETGRTVAVEALARWQHAVRGRVEPEQFIGLAEETGMIVPFGLWILRTACTQAREWQVAFPVNPVALTVNVSARQLQEPDFVSAVGEILRETELEPSCLILEITESLLLDDRDTIVVQLNGLKAFGLRLAVDDFGTGYSALSHLRHYPIDILKIDRTFIEGIDVDADKAKLVRGILNLGASLMLDVIAEGIEHAEQVKPIRDMDLRLAQGFFFSRPLPPGAVAGRLAAEAQADATVTSLG